MTETRILVLIPARMASTRLPGKPLPDIGGLPMIVHVMRRAEAAQIGPVVVATDTPEIAAAVKAGGGEAVMTRADHPSGSDRIFEALRHLDPGRPGRDRRQSCRAICRPSRRRHPRGARAARRPGGRYRDAGAPKSAPRRKRTNPNVVKAVGSPVGRERLRALYFTRATAPYGDGPLYHHIGLYAYRRAALERFVALPPSPLEQREKLEQLRALEAGMRIDVAIVDTVPLRRRHAGDLENARAHARQGLSRLLQGAHMTKQAENRLPGRAGRQFPHRHRRGLSGRRAAALRDLRGRARRDLLAARPISA